MAQRLKPFPKLAQVQQQASSPATHAALAASAGTGKTHVLTARVLRLLLRGAPPETILCLTFHQGRRGRDGGARPPAAWPIGCG
jgi:ATP-dependent helicase/nuclease subunit A